MSVREEIETKRSALQELCRKIGIPGLRVVVYGESWNDVTFVGDLDVSRLSGYADRFFQLDEGLVRTFHRRVHMVDEEAYNKARLNRVTKAAAQQIELLHAS